MSALEHIANDIWVCKAAHTFAGLHVGTRMTIVRLSTGGVLLHSPIALSADVRAELDAIGPVRHIVCPNMFHHMYAADALSAYPTAKLHGPAKLHKKRKDLRFDAVLSEVPDADWQQDFITISIEGSLLGETVLYHQPSKTLITCDLVENFKSHPHWFTRTYLKLNGMFGHITWPPVMRVLYINRKAARRSMDRILALPFERIIIAHGDNITSDARETLRRGLLWL